MRSVRFNSESMLLCGDCVDKYTEEGSITMEDSSGFPTVFLTFENTNSSCMRCKKIAQKLHSIEVKTKVIINEDSSTGQTDTSQTT